MHDLNKNAEILFVGLNPSGDSRENLYDTSNNICDDVDGYIKDNIHKVQNHLPSNTYSKYFGIFHRIANDVYNGGDTTNIDGRKSIKVSNDIDKVEHIDLFYCTGTDSDQVMNWIDKTKSDQHGIDVFNTVLKYLKNIKVVVFNNVNSSKIIKKTMINSKMTGKLTYKYKIDSREIDLIFQGTMGYGRLDEYAQERLVRIIKNVLKIP